MREHWKSRAAVPAVAGLLLLLQAVWLGVFFWKLAAYSVWLNAAFTLLSLLIVLHILYHDDVSGFKIGWIILILQLPVMGGLLYAGAYATAGGVNVNA